MPKDEPHRYSAVPMIRLVKPDGPDDLKRVVELVTDDGRGTERPRNPPSPRY